MIIGIGTDIVDISRIEGIVNRHSDAFLKKIFTEAELIEAERKNQNPQYYAGRWAVKEALSKALGCGIGANCNWLDITTNNDEHGCPHTTITGTAKQFAAKRDLANIHVSITHDMNIAFAAVVLERE